MLTSEENVMKYTNRDDVLNVAIRKPWSFSLFLFCEKCRTTTTFVFICQYSPIGDRLWGFDEHDHSMELKNVD